MIYCHNCHINPVTAPGYWCTSCMSKVSLDPREWVPEPPIKRIWRPWVCAQCGRHQKIGDAGRVGTELAICEPCYRKLRPLTPLEEVARERLSQTAAWGVQHHPDFDPLALDEEYAFYRVPREEWAKAVCEGAREGGRLTWGHIAAEEVAEVFNAKDPASLREELLQLAAVCVAWVEDIDAR